MRLQQIIRHMPNEQLQIDYPSQAAIIGTGSHRPIVDALAQLFTHQHSTSIGYMECTPDTVTELINECIKKDIVAIIIGDGHFIPDDYPFSIATVAPLADFKEKSRYQYILRHSQLDLFSVIGFQTYFTSSDEIAWLHEHNYEMLRLGVFREKPALAEPLLRESNHIFFDVNALRASDAPETEKPAPNGLYAEEMCQLAAFAGRAPQLKSFHLFGYAAELTPCTLTAQIAAHVLWHLLEGIAVRSRLTIPDQQNVHTKKIIVDMGENRQVLNFINDTLTGYWWMQIPLAGGTYRNVACLHDDYLCACKHEVPIRWLRYYQKFNKSEDTKKI